MASVVPFNKSKERRTLGTVPSTEHVIVTIQVVGKAGGRRVQSPAIMPFLHHGVWKRESGLDRTEQVDGNYI